MADAKISALTALTGAGVDSAADLLAIVDTSATATKKITVAQLFATPSLTLVTPILGIPTSGTLTNCTLPVGGVTGLGTGVATFLTTPSSANLRSALTDETGTGAAVFANTPTLVTPILGTPTSGNLANCTGYPIVLSSADVSGALPLTINAQTGTSYTVLAGDQGKLVTFSNASAVAVTLAQATGSFGSGWSAIFLNLGAGTVTITPTTSTINAGATIALSTGMWIMAGSNGTNYVGPVGVGLTAAQLTNLRTTQVTMSIGDGVNNIAANDVSFPVPCVFAGTIVGYTITADAGTCTIKTWKKATGTAIPTVADVISTSGVGLSTGTLVRSATVSDFTTAAVAANDVFIVQATAVASSPKKITFTLEILKT